MSRAECDALRGTAVHEHTGALCPLRLTLHVLVMSATVIVTVGVLVPSKVSTRWTVADICGNDPTVDVVDTSLVIVPDTG
jgi:hypothetical protein